MRLKIAQVATADISIRLLLLDQIQALAADGHEVVAICAPGPSLAGLRDAGVAVQTVPMEREIAPLDDFRSLRGLVRLFREAKFDVVHTHTPKAGLIGPIAARLAGVPRVVHTIHGLLFHDRMPRMRQMCFWAPEKITATFCDHLLSQSREDIDRAIQSRLCKSDKITYLGNGIDIRRFAPPSVSSRAAKLQEVGLLPSDFVVGSVGRLVKEKGFAELFAAAELITTRYPTIKFVVIGPQETDQNDALDPAYMRELQRRGVVRFVNWCDDMNEWYAAMDVFVLPSHREGIPRACMEAAAMMLPVVATDIRGCREVVLHENTGLLVPPRDVPRLVQAIEVLYEQRKLAAQMGQRARQHIVNNFDSKAVCSRLCEFYAHLGSRKAVLNSEESAYYRP